MDKRLVLLACFCTVFTAYAIRYGYGVLLPEMLPYLGLSKTEAGVIYSSFFIAYTVGSPVLGLLSDRYNARWLLSLFVFILGTGAFLMSYSSNITQASLFYTLAGIGSAACWAPVMALAQRWTSDKNRGKTLAFIDIGSALGIIGTGTVVPLIVVAYDWRAGWISLGALGFFVAVLNFFTIKDRPPETYFKNQKGQQTRESLSVTFTRLFSNFRFWLIGLAYLLTGFSVLVPFTFLSTYAVRELAFSYEVAASLLTVIGAGAIIGKVTLGPISDKLGRIKVMMLCAVLIASGCLGMAYGQRTALFIFTAVFSLGYGVVWAMYAAAASDYFPKMSAGTTVGLWTLFLGIGSILSPITSGWIADTTGTLAWSFVLAAAGAVVSIIFLVPVWRARID